MAPIGEDHAGRAGERLAQPGEVRTRGAGVEVDRDEIPLCRKKARLFGDPLGIAMAEKQVGNTRHGAEGLGHRNGTRPPRPFARTP